MQKITIAKKECVLRYDMTAYEMIEETFGGLDEMIEQMNGKKRRAWTICELVRILVNAQRIADGETPDITHAYITSNMSPRNLGAMDRAASLAIAEGMRMDSAKDDEEDRDVVLDEIEKKTEA